MTNAKHCPYCTIAITSHSHEQARACLTKLAGIQEIRDGVTRWLIEQAEKSDELFSKGRA